MTYSPLVSIIVPCYNQQLFLLRALDSVVKQEYQNIEVVVIDDGSTELVFIPELEKKLRIKLIHQDNRGLAQARNTGLSVASGEWVKFLDADDVLLPDCIQKQINSVSSKANSISIIGYIEEDEQTKSQIKCFPQFGKPTESILIVNLAPIHCFLYPLKELNKIGFFDISERVNGGHEDYDLHLRLLATEIDVVTVQNLGVVYYKRAGSMSSFTQTMVRTRIDVWCEHVEKYLKMDSSASMMSAVLIGWCELISLQKHLSPNNFISPVLINCGKLIEKALSVTPYLIENAEINAISQKLSGLKVKQADLINEKLQSSNCYQQIIFSPQDIIDKRLVVNEMTKIRFNEQWLFNVFDIISSNDTNYVIYGAGTLCERLLDIIGDRKQPLYIMDRNASNIKCLRNIPVVLPEKSDIEPVHNIIISSINHALPIERKLKKLFPNLSII